MTASGGEIGRLSIVGGAEVKQVLNCWTHKSIVLV